MSPPVPRIPNWKGAGSTTETRVLALTEEDRDLWGRDVAGWRIMVENHDVTATFTFKVYQGRWITAVASETALAGSTSAAISVLHPRGSGDLQISVTASAGTPTASMAAYPRTTL